jgi:hypothetical protein
MTAPPLSEQLSALFVIVHHRGVLGCGAWFADRSQVFPTSRRTYNPLKRPWSHNLGGSKPYKPYTLNPRDIQWGQLRLYPFLPQISSKWFRRKTAEQRVMYYPNKSGYLVIFVLLNKSRDGTPDPVDVGKGRNCARNFLSVVVCAHGAPLTV